MFKDFLNTAYTLHQAQQPFAIAFVVRREQPSSGKPGDKAIIKPDGTISGWVGGGCTRGIIIGEALAALQDGHPRMVRISPNGVEEERNGVLDYKMTCHSGGTVEVYIEPIMPKPHLLVIGKYQTTKALVKLAKAMEYTVTLMSHDIDPAAFPEADTVLESITIPPEHLSANTFIVVATQGDGDEIALTEALNSHVPYVAFVASRRKANAVFNQLRKAGMPTERLQQVKTPAGLDIGAKLPEEVAISILAEIVSLKRKGELATPTAEIQQIGDNSDIFINPVCNVPVQKSAAKHVITHQGVDVYFCCDGCKVSFEQEPEKYMQKLVAS